MGASTYLTQLIMLHILAYMGGCINPVSANGQASSAVSEEDKAINGVSRAKLRNSDVARANDGVKRHRVNNEMEILRNYEIKYVDL